MGAERHPDDAVGVARESADGLAGDGIPQPHGLVVADSGQQCTVRTERHPADAPGLALESPEVFGVLGGEASRCPGRTHVNAASRPAGCGRDQVDKLGVYADVQVVAARERASQVQGVFPVPRDGSQPRGAWPTQPSDAAATTPEHEPIH